MTCKLVGRAVNDGKCIQASVMPVFLKKEDVLANVSMNFNAIESDSPTLGKAVFTGQGAGSLPTAHAVVQDIYDIAYNEAMDTVDAAIAPVVNNKEKTFYLRTVNLSLYEAVCKEKIDENTCLTKKITLDELHALIGKNEDKDLFVAEVQE